jgi:catechol 2,3-dioxygenase-like lactoylglutathione lyase family enzyme
MEERMLGDNDAIATIAVKDLKAAKTFYEGTLGLKPTRNSEPETLNYKSGNTPVLVYKSQFAGTNKATAVTWVVRDTEAVVKELKGKGVTFEHYDMPGMTRKGDVHITGKMKAAWFKDPDGNILAVVGE